MNIASLQTQLDLWDFHQISWSSNWSQLDFSPEISVFHEATATSAGFQPSRAHWRLCRRPGGEYWRSSSKVMETWENIPKGWKINIILIGKCRNETHHFLKIWDDSFSSISDSHKIVSQFLRHMHIWLFNSIIVISPESNDNNICCRYSPQTICYLRR